MIKLERKKENKNRQHTHERESIILVDLENNEFQKEKGTVNVLENNEFGKEKGTGNGVTEVKQPTPAKISEEKSLMRTTLIRLGRMTKRQLTQLWMREWKTE